VYRGDKLPRRYIGSTSIDKISKGYNGSVVSKKYGKIFLEEQKKNKHLFKTRILRKFSSRKEAFEEELRLHIKYNVIYDDSYMNLAMAQDSGYFGGAGEDNPMYGQGHKLLGDKNGMYKAERTKEWRDQHSSFMRGNQNAVGANWSKEARKKKSEQMKKVPHNRTSCVKCHKEMTIQNIERHSKKCTVAFLYF
jgi:hypothetical protein